MYLCMACMSHQFQRDFWFTAFAFRQIRWGISEGLKNISGKTHPMVLQSARVSVYISVCIYVSVYVHTCDCVTFIRHCLIQFRWIISLGSCVYFHGFIFLGASERILVGPFENVAMSFRNLIGKGKVNITISEIYLAHCRRLCRFGACKVISSYW